MSNRKRRIGSIKAELLAKSREAALNAVQTFNNPLTTFKTETFIVLMVIAWMYLLHAYYNTKRIDYRYYQKKTKRRHFDRTKSGAYKYWELERCLNEESCPLDSATKSNLRFLIGLRHEIEHHKSAGIDESLTGRHLVFGIMIDYLLRNAFRTVTLSQTSAKLYESCLSLVSFSDSLGDRNISAFSSNEAENLPIRFERLSFPDLVWGTINQNNHSLHTYPLGDIIERSVKQTVVSLFLNSPRISSTNIENSLTILWSNDTLVL